MRRIDTPGALDERPVDLELRSVRVQVHLLVRMLAVIVRRHIAGDHDHRDRVERGVGHAGGGVGEPRAQVRKKHRCLAGRARVTIGGVGRDLLVPAVDELDLLALRQRRQHSDVGVAAQAENVLDAARLEVADELFSDRVSHCYCLLVSCADQYPSGSERCGGPL